MKRKRIGWVPVINGKFRLDACDETKNGVLEILKYTTIKPDRVLPVYVDVPEKATK